MFSSSDITDPGFLPSGADDIAGVRFASTSTLVCTQITFDKCAFLGLAYGVNTNQEIRGITVSNSRFNTLWQGVVLGTGATVNGGPTGFRAVQNFFDVIYAEGIVYDDVSLNASAYNIFYNVGYSIGSTTPTYSIIAFGNDNNVSISDMFERSTADSYIKPRISITGSTTVTGGTQLQLGRLSIQNGLTYTILNGLTQTIVTINNDDVKAFKMYYTITRENTVRTGTFTVVSGPDDSTGSTAYDDNYIENNNTGVTMFVDQSGSATQVKCTATAVGSNGTLTYSISSLA
jgi:hypothetical protein